MIRHFEAAQRAFKSHDLDTSERHLERVLEYAPNHPGARHGIEKIKRQRAEIDECKLAWRSERARHRLVAAQSAVRAWSRLVGPTDSELRAAQEEVSEALSQAQALVVRARHLARTDSAAAREVYREALARASDLPEAREGLRQCPPDGPTELRAEVSTGRIRLSWTGPKPDGLGPVSYRVIRKRAAAPQHIEDGQTVVEVSTTHWDDTSPSPGESFGYGVYSVRNGVSSLLGVAAGPFLMLGEVTNVRVEVRGGEIQLSWTPPVGAAGVRVVRKLGSPPEGPRDGEPVEAQLDRVIDQGLVDDRAYHYGLFSLFPAPGGRLYASRGVFVVAVPHPPIPPVDDLTIAAESDGRLRLTWSPPERGQVRVIRTEGSLEMSPGDQLSETQAEALPGVWLEQAEPGLTFETRSTGLKLGYYTPLTFQAGTVVVGRELAFSHVADPSELRAVRSSEPDKVLLRWKWNPMGSHCLLAARPGRFAEGPQDPEAITEMVQDEEYARLRRHVLTLPPRPDGPWHISVFTVATSGGRTLLSPGIEPTSRAVVPEAQTEVNVSYRLRAPILPGRPWSLSFRTEPPGVEVPPTILVAHPKIVPLSPDDGEIAARFPAAADGRTLEFRPGISLASQRLRLFLDPQASPGDGARIRLRHPQSGVAKT